MIGNAMQIHEPPVTSQLLAAIACAQAVIYAVHIHPILCMYTRSILQRRHGLKPLRWL